MGFNDLPKINERKAQSNSMMEKLGFAIFDSIKKFEEDNDYKFESYEVDAVFLDIVLKRHRGYLRAKFGQDFS